MNKKEWISEKAKLLEHLKIAQKNKKTAEDQIEELEITLEAYDKKIRTFK